MRSGLGFMSPPWAPLNLGSALIFATDPGDANCAPNDGSGNCATLKHLYDGTKALQAPSGARPTINAAGGATSNKRVLNFRAAGAGRYLRGNLGTPFTSLIDAANGSLASTNYTVVQAVKLAGDAATAWAEPYVWINSTATKWCHVIQKGANGLHMRVNDGTTQYEAASAVDYTGWRFITTTKNGTSLVLRVNGAQVATGTYGGAGSFTAADFLVNATLDGVGAISTPDDRIDAMAGMIVTNNALSGLALTQAEAWVRATAGL